MLSLLSLWLQRYDSAAGKPSRGWCNDVSLDEKEAVAEWEAFLDRHEDNQFEPCEKIEKSQRKDVSDDVIGTESDKTRDHGDWAFHSAEKRLQDALSATNNAECQDHRTRCEDFKNAFSTKTVTPEQDDDDFDELIFSLTPETCPGPPASIQSRPSTTDVRIFVATWNMAAKDPFAHRRRGHFIGDTLAAKALQGLLPLGYDLYVIGTQEKVTKYLDAAVLARLAQPNYREEKARTGSMYHRLVVPANETNPRLQVCQCRKAEAGAQCTPLAHRSSFGGSDGTCSLCSPKSFTTTSQPCRTGLCRDETPAYVSAPGTRTCPCSCWSQKTEELEIRGHGDHALIHRKSTSLSLYYASHLDGHIAVVSTGSHKFTGSKGGIAITIRIQNDPQTLTFVNCHLEANSLKRRLWQLNQLACELPRSLARVPKDSKDDTLATCSDHVIWIGDFNYRLQHLESTQVVHFLTAGRLQELHDTYDSMAKDLVNVPGLRSFREPVKWPTFYPTYKKRPNRSRLPLSGSTTGMGRTTRWVQHVYKTRYREPFYKGGRVRERVPGWCDRILLCSREGLWQDYLRVEQIACSASSSPSRCRVEGKRDNYRALNDELRGSDHSPVSCTFLWSVHH